MAGDISSLIVALVLGALGVLFLGYRQRHPQVDQPPATTATVQRLLNPHPPDDCPACRDQLALFPRAPGRPSPVRPWRERKSRRGAPKRIATHGFACPNPACDYYHITDAQIHALVGDGLHGKTERIQTFRCQACSVTFSARRDTPLYRLKTPALRVGEVLTALAKGLESRQLNGSSAIASCLPVFTSDGLWAAPVLLRADGPLR